MIQTETYTLVLETSDFLQVWEDQLKRRRAVTLNKNELRMEEVIEYNTTTYIQKY